MCQTFEVVTPDGGRTFEEGETVYITLNPPGAYFMIRFSITGLKDGRLEISGDVLQQNGESNCDGICVQPVDNYTVQVWTT